MSLEELHVGSRVFRRAACQVIRRRIQERLGNGHEKGWRGGDEIREGGGGRGSVTE